LLDPKLQPKWAELSLQPDPRTPQALEQLRVAEVAKWRPVITNSGFVIE
jgi:tripartite-type tricarboxylate transporter receptor subunit TctC